jgi:hypothetical protein
MLNSKIILTYGEKIVFSHVYLKLPKFRYDRKCSRG